MDKRRKNKLILFSEIIINIAGLALIYLIIWFIYYRYSLNSPFLYKKGTAILIFIYAVLYFVFTKIYGGHRIGDLRVSEIIYSQVLSVIFLNVITFLQICLIDRRVVAIKPIIIMSVLDFIFIVIWSFWCNKRFQKRNIAKEITVIYENSVPHSLIAKMKCYDYKFRITKVINTEGGYDEIIKKIDKTHGLVLCEIEPNIQRKILKYCFENSIKTYLIPNVEDIILRGSSIVNLLDMPLFLCNTGGISMFDEIFKRIFDIVLSLFACILFSPIMLITALFIKIEDKGAVIFKQKRLTVNGKEFYVYKFRSMIVDAEKDGVARLAQNNDSRITNVGKVIRMLRIDELPQLFNILKGDMSIVGPRPERPEIACQYEEFIPEFSYRLKVKAGLTGYAQVLGRYNTTPYDKLMWDMMYIENYTFFLDLKLIMMTIKILFMPESTQGLEKSETIAGKKTENINL